jgi:hypothetical protein
MRVGKRTARLVAEAMVLAFVQGSRWGQVHPLTLSDEEAKEAFPKDSQIIAGVLRDARSFRDTFPTLSRAEWPTESTEAGEA